ncbi:IclR family transcriptional regulator [Petroclostridium sp. X23]|uniref:IclR family transcriptional regulator n=1 Tax=Petroclostridium sp. X23 TaxID=3045146 RepID=UPI0024AC938F|nr:IclR family transcriptional regulator [Petroclostridium sp. X23]WHH59278.1 IclR family transcriptional regulator [Petroclostridium sp. X23]
MNKKKTGIIQSVDRALTIVETMYNAKEELGVTELADIIGLHKSTTFGLLSTLENRGFVTQNKDTGKYGLGLKFLEIGTEILENMDVRQIIKPYLRDLSEKYQETVHFAVEDDNMVVYIDKIESPRALVIKSSIGKRNPMHCTGVGKCLLSFMSEEKQNEILKEPLEKYTDNTIVDPKNLNEEIDKIRKNGYSIDNEEIEIGLRCIAAPIFDYKGELLGGISISGPSTRMTDERIVELIEPLKSTASKISKSLGHYKHI